tara:strand:+ start:1559 stop:1825 length:267 start_codon:yes stop_codon:yes gene_type:complete
VWQFASVPKQFFLATLTSSSVTVKTDSFLTQKNNRFGAEAKAKTDKEVSYNFCILKDEQTILIVPASSVHTRVDPLHLRAAAQQDSSN